MYILITANNCPKCEAMKQKLKEKKIEYSELQLSESDPTSISITMTKLRTSNIFRTDVPILVKSVGDEWEEVECE